MVKKFQESLNLSTNSGLALQSGQPHECSLINHATKTRS